jgi:acetyl esterase/lipase
MTWNDLTSRDLPQPTSTHAYGDDPAQVADLWLPDGPGPHPTVLMVHGGCWQKEIADRTLMNYAAEDLRGRGLAVWNIEYRGVDEIGGGYPGTFLDVSLAANSLLEQGPELGLDVARIVAIGHSAGGHLAAWLAAQPNIAPESALNTGRTIPLTAVIISGGLADLKASAPVTLESCLRSIMSDLTGPPDEQRLDIFSDTSPAELLPVDTRLISVNGQNDRIAPPVLGRSFTAAVLAAGGQADYVEIAKAGHVELISPGTDAFETQAKLIKTLLVRP